MLKAAAGATLAVAFAAGALPVMPLFAVSPPAYAQSALSPAPLRTPPGVAARTPMLRQAPAPRAIPKARLAPGPQNTPGSTTSGSSGMLGRGAGSNCRAQCGSQCQLTSCSGMNVSQCASIRQQCRSNCRSRCR